MFYNIKHNFYSVIVVFPCCFCLSVNNIIFTKNQSSARIWLEIMIWRKKKQKRIRFFSIKKEIFFGVLKTKWIFRFFSYKRYFSKMQIQIQKSFCVFLHIYEHKKSSSYFLIFREFFQYREKNLPLSKKLFSHHSKQQSIKSIFQASQKTKRMNYSDIIWRETNPTRNPFVIY